jgi:hypothetical protein
MSPAGDRCRRRRREYATAMTSIGGSSGPDDLSRASLLPTMGVL